MKIAIMSRFPNDPNNPKGGVETATIGLVYSFIKYTDLEIHVITLENNITGAIIEEHDKYTVHRLPKSKWPLFLDIIIGPGKSAIVNYCKQLNVDLIHYQETYGLCAYASEIPSLFTLHGFDSRNLITEKKWLWPIRSLIWKQVEKYCLKKLQYIVSITPYVTNEINSITNAKLFYIDNSISEDYFSLARQEKVGRIFFAGWINPRKNLLTVIRALKILIDNGINVDLHAAGEVRDQEYMKVIMNEISTLKVSKNIKLLGRINQNEIKRELCEASVFVLPSTQENAPMAIAEAMAAGTPVISSNLCGMPFMINHNITGFLTDPMDAQTIAKFITKLITDKDLHQNISKMAKDEAINRYHPKAVASKTLAAYQEILSNT